MNSRGLRRSELGSIRADTTTQVGVYLITGHAALTDVFQWRRVGIETRKTIMSKQKVSRDLKHYLVKRPDKILTSSLSWNEVQAELRDTYGEADEAMLFRGIVTEDGTEYRDKYADSRTQVTEHRDQ